MKYEGLGLLDSKIEYKKLEENNFKKYKTLSSDYEKIRNDLLEKYNEIKKDISPKDVRKNYKKDLYFGLKMYEYLTVNGDVNTRVTSDDNFWRYMAICVIPEIVYDRYIGYNLENYYRKTSSRLWLKIIWWFIHISWQGTYEQTKILLDNSRFDSDKIQNTVDRIGKKGINLNLFRKIIELYALIPEDALKKYNNEIVGRNNLYRDIMKLYTAKKMIFSASLYDGGEENYARMLYNKLGIEI